MTTETSIYEYAKQGLSYGAERTALWFYGRSISYGSLFEMIDNVADYFYALGVRQGTVVTIHLPNCPQAVIAIYAVSKLGGICNMVHPQVPADGLRENVSFTKSTLVISYQENLQDIATVLTVDVSFFMEPEYQTKLNIHSFQSTFEQAFKRNENQKNDYNHLRQERLCDACVVYLNSSGTTGVPKTVMHSHAAINRSVENAATFYKFIGNTSAVELALLPLFHGTGFAHIMHMVLSNGAELVQMLIWDTELASKFIKERKVNYLCGVPKIYYSLLKCDQFDGTTIKEAFVVGDSVPLRLKTQFNRKTGNKSCMFEAYGLTEIVSGCAACDEDHDRLEATGYPMDHNSLAVIKEDGAVSSCGEGEIVVNNNSFMLGYLGDPEATRKSFIEFDGKVWLKTGDKGFIDESGYLYYKGRLKDIIVHNGYNVYPYELEKLGRTVEGVSDICVIGIRIPEINTQRIRAYVVPDEGTDIAGLEEKLFTKWKNVLPRFSVPQEICFIDHFPVNLMNKIDRKALEKLP